MATYGFIGLGLIGGSLAKSIRKAEPDATILAASRTPETLQTALEMRLIDHACSITDSKFAACDMLFLCAPVETNIQILPSLRPILQKECLLSDVGSVKGVMAQAAREAGLADQFIGGHPMAGTEQTGLQYASDLLLENAYYFLTPLPETKPEALERYRELLLRIHALPLLLTPDLHDQVVAGVSHLPHLAASALVETLRELDTDEEIMKLVAAGGFRDITRIASSSPEVWEQICLTNEGAICRALDQYIQKLTSIQQLLSAQDRSALHTLLADAREYRNSLDDSHRGAMPREYALYIDLYDQAGGIAKITALLAKDDINIRNIGILHNREFVEGVLRIEFDAEKARDRALQSLQEHDYRIRKTQ